MLPKAPGPASPAATLGFGTALGPFWDHFGTILGPLAEILQHPAPTAGCVPSARAPEEMVLLLLMAVGNIYAVVMDDGNTTWCSRGGGRQVWGQNQ